jgi:hypothetical protein
MKEKLTKPQLTRLLDRVFRPKTHGLSQDERDEAFLMFCAGCPDPIQAWRLVTDSVDPLTNDELVDRALSMQVRPMTDVPESEFPARHPLRKLAL